MTSFNGVKTWASMFFKRTENIPKPHKHQFLDKLENVEAIWRKRDCPGDEVHFRGTLRECVSCGAYRLRVPGLREVEVTV